MPQTTEVAWSWTTTVPPAARISAGAVAPVGAHAGEDDGRARRRRRRSRPSGTAGRPPGRQKFSGGPWVRPVVQAARPPARTTRWWSPGARCTVPGTQRAAVGGLDHAQRAEPVQALGELAGEDRRHVLDEQDRHRAASAGSCGSTRARASGPPVEEPIDQDGGLLARARCAARPGAAAGGGARGAGRAQGDRAAGERLDLAGSAARGRSPSTGRRCRRWPAWSRTRWRRPTARRGWRRRRARSAC